MKHLVLAALLSGTGTFDVNPIVPAAPPVAEAPAAVVPPPVEPKPDEAACRKLVKKAKRKAFWGSLAIATLNSMAAQQTAYTTVKTPYGNSTARTTWTDRSRADAANERDITAIYDATRQKVAEAGCSAYFR